MRLDQPARRYGLTAVAGVAAAVLLAGCGGSGKGSAASSGAGPLPASASTTGTSTPNAVLAASVEKTFSAKNAKIHFDINTNSNGQPLSFGGDGVLDLTAKKFQLTANLPAASGVSGRIEIRVIDNVLYVKLPAAASAVTGGKPWIKVGAAVASASLGNVGILTQDPTQLLAALRSVSSDVKDVGTADIRGVKTTHYRAIIDLQKAAQANPEAAKNLQKYEAQLGSTSLPADVYIDGQGLTRRFVVALAPAQGSDAAADGASTVTVDLYDFGAADTAQVQPPPADETGTFALDLGGAHS